MNNRYEGEISISDRVTECKPDGDGKVTAYQQGGAVSWTYEGAFVNGRITGEGTTTYGDPYPDYPHLAGQVYIGAHVNGKAHGQGTWYYRGGAVQYVGNHQKGECHGKGTWYYPDGAVEYVGDNQNGDYHGQGISYRNDGAIMNDGTREDGAKEYDGQWEESCWKGNGTLYRPDGTISREGEWVNGGSEEYEWQEGEEAFWYEGDWDEDGWILHGWGILYRPDRITVEREGWWQNGEDVDGPPPGHPEAPPDAP